MNREELFINFIEEEIKFLNDCVLQSSTEGWSTHLNSPMKKRISEISDLYFAYKSNLTQNQMKSKN